MKKLLFVFGLLLSIVACTNSTRTVENSTSVDTTVVDSAMIDTISID